MSAYLNDPAFVRLASVLEQEKELLQSGRAAEAASLIGEKMSALQDFEAIVQGMGELGATMQKRRAIEEIVQMAEENAAHMDAIRNGIRHAIRRLESLNDSAFVGSYGRGGAQLSFTNATGSYNRKG
jgi:thioredoxin-like negative regulator of GroEL